MEIAIENDKENKKVALDNFLNFVPYMLFLIVIIAFLFELINQTQGTNYTYDSGYDVLSVTEIRSDEYVIVIQSRDDKRYFWFSYDEPVDDEKIYIVQTVYTPLVGRTTDKGLFYNGKSITITPIGIEKAA